MKDDRVKIIDYKTGDEKFKEAAPNMQYYVDNGEWIDHKMRDGLTMKAKVFRKEGATKTLVLVIVPFLFIT